MGGGNMNKPLSDYVKKNYPDGKADLMTCFMEAGIQTLMPRGFLGMINLPSWLFLSSFEKLRKKLITTKHIDSLLHMGRGIFGVDWGSTAFILKNQIIDSPAKYFKLHKRNFQHIYPEDIRDIFLRAKNDSSTKINFDKYRGDEGTADVVELLDESGLRISYIANQKDFEKIPGSPIGYWLSEKLINLFSKGSLSEIGSGRNGLTTGNNERFLREWFELSSSSLTLISIEESDYKWVQYRKGGSYQKWYGNNNLFINWKNNGASLRKNKNTIFRNPDFFFKQGITWSLTGSNGFGARLCDYGGVFDVNGMTFFPDNDSDILKVLSFLNSKISEELLKVINPTLAFQSGNIESLPLLIGAIGNDLEKTKNCISIVKNSQGTDETNLFFKQNDFLNHESFSIEESYDLYCQYWAIKFHQLRQNEEELNRQFIEIYGLEEELTPDVPLEDITILKAETKIENGQLLFDAQEVFAQFVSYAVGCMMGRYSLDKEGLILANQGETLQDYWEKVGQAPETAAKRFIPDDDAIIPVLDDEWFEDDVVGRFYAFLKVTLGEKDFQKNLAFVEEQLGKDIRKYFVRDFYKDHIKRYKKRPIYWLFSSPEGYFSVLVYLHRYTPDTINLILNQYLRDFIQKLKSQKSHLQQILVSGSTAEQNKATKQIDQLDKMILDCEVYERDILYPLATERIALDLDDGVLVNYNKLGKAVQEVKGLNDKKTKKKVRGFDWIDVERIRD
jgi:hypothetical protein